HPATLDGLPDPCIHLPHNHSLRPSIYQLPRPPRSTLFPYTTLFRSRKRTVLPGPSRSKHRAVRQHPLRISLQPAAHNFIVNADRSEEHTSELQSRENLVCRLPREKKTTSDNASTSWVCSIERSRRLA